MKRFRALTALFLVVGGTVSLCHFSKAAGPVPAMPAVPAVHSTGIPEKITIDLNKATPVKLPVPKFDLRATVFETPDHKEGWVVKLPGGRPLATPAYSNGMLFVGGGYGSHEFYAFDAASGKMIWQYKTGDDGPTAAVVEDGYCAFNTESCTIYVLDAKSGKLVWQQWLGDPLMSQPAIWNGFLYMAYPGGQGKSKQSGHRMLCADLKTGKHIWDAPITSDVISAPVLHDGKAYFSCQDGTSFCLDATTGKQIFKKADASTSAPLVSGGQVMKSQKARRANETFERLALEKGNSSLIVRDYRAEYLAQKSDSQKMVAAVPGLSLGDEATQDASVGFATAPAAAGLSSVQSNIPLGSVVAGWAYQGSRPAFNKNKKLVVNAQGSYINAVGDEAAKAKVNWSAQASGGGINNTSQVFSPPALGKENIYLVSGRGHMLALDQNDGKVQFSYATNEPMMFQPALANGNMYVGTSNGMLVCLKTGSEDANGWSSWGGNAQHNKD